MLLAFWSWLFTSLLSYIIGAKLPDPEVEVEVLHKPFICHRKSKYGDIMLVHYEGFLEDGSMFHSRGLTNMCAGERRKLTIPPALAYGKEGKGKYTCLTDTHTVKEYLRKEFQRHGYPPNDTHHEAMAEDIFKKEDENKDGFISAREFTYKHDE
ncbi:hypothetical protein JZ751_013425, partial [Albula glossodonta]